MLGFSSVTIPTLLLDDSEIHATKEGMSWMASLVCLGGILGTMIGGLTADAIGRKRTILLSSIIYSIGWIVIGQASEVPDLLAGIICKKCGESVRENTTHFFIRTRSCANRNSIRILWGICSSM